MPLSLAHILSFLSYTPPAGTRPTPTTVPILPVSPTLHHSRCAPPPHPTSSFACSVPLHTTCLPDVCSVTSTEALVFEKAPLRPWNHRSPRGAITLLGPDPIPDFSLISGSPGDKASTRSGGPVARVTCHGNQDSPLA